MRRIVLTVIACAVALTAQEAAAQETAGPTQAPPTTIVYSDSGMSRMADLPMGVHRITDSNVIISGHQKGGGLGVLFGVVGMAIQSSANAEGGTAKVRNVEDDLRFDATAKAVELTKAILADERYRERFKLSAEPSGRTLNVTPYIVITFVNETDVRPYVVLKTKPAAGTSKEAPKALKYFCCEGKALPLLGENGLAENNGARLKELLTSELETAIQVMLLDRSQPLPRDKKSRLVFNGYFPFVGKPFKMKGYDLGRYNGYSLIEFPPGALVFGGVNIAEPGSLEIVPPKAK